MQGTRIAIDAPVDRFNQRCRRVAFLWLWIGITCSILWRPTAHDFSQFYMGGLLARQGKWEALYPIPNPRGLDNPGLAFHSKAKSQWLAALLFHGVPNDTRFILPPPSALFFIPWSLLDYPLAFSAWTFFLIACTWGVACMAGDLMRLIVGRSSRWEGGLFLLIAFSPMTARAIRIANVSPPIAFLIGFVLRGLLVRDPPLRGAAAILVGALFKYATMILTPLLVAMRRWKLLGWLFFLGVLALLLTYFLAGKATFLEFYQVILPTLSRPSVYRGNQSLAGMLARIFGRPFFPKLSLFLKFLSLATLGVAFFSLLRLPARRWSDPPTVMAGAALLLSWLFIFSPIAWEHWPIFLCPVWGWLLWEGHQSKVWRRVVAWGSLALMYFPAGIIQVPGIAAYPVYLPEPFNSWQLFGVIGVFALALRRVLIEIERRESILHIPNSLE